MIEQLFKAFKKDKGKRWVHNSCAICSQPSCTTRKVQRKKSTIQKEMLGCEIRKEAKISHFHSLNCEMLIKYKEKHVEASEHYVQGRGSVMVKGEYDCNMACCLAQSVDWKTDPDAQDGMSRSDWRGQGMEVNGSGHSSFLLFFSSTGAIQGRSSVTG